ncbi:MAG: FecR family protein [Candidatus Omnitrophota bacterium]
MSGFNDLEKLESFLRRTRLQSTVNKAHKERLRQKLLAAPIKPLFPYLRFAVAGATSFLLLFIVYSNINLNPIVGTSSWIVSAKKNPLVDHVEWNAPGVTQKSIHCRTNYKTGAHSAELLLDEGSLLRFSPFSSFEILSSSTSREKEDIVIALDYGTLKADVAKALGNTLYVRTPDVEIKVIGTKFTVSVTR